MIEDSNAAFFEELPEQFAAAVQPLSPFGFLDEYCDCGGGSGGYGGWEGSREELAAAGVPQPFAQFGAACHESAEGSAGLAEGTDADGHTVIELLQFADAAAMFAEDTGAVSFIHNKHCVKFAGKLVQGGQIGNCAIHTVDCICDDEHKFKLTASSLQSVV